MSDYITEAIILTILFWSIAVIIFAICESEGCLSESIYRIILGFVFWPIGIPVLSLVGLFCLIRLCFSNEEKDEFFSAPKINHCEYCGSTDNLMHMKKCFCCGAPKEEN